MRAKDAWMRPCAACNAASRWSYQAIYKLVVALRNWRSRLRSAAVVRTARRSPLERSVKRHIRLQAGGEVRAWGMREAGR